MAYLSYYIAENKIKGQIKEKPDDYGPLWDNYLYTIIKIL
jgi:hypothetical protein